MRQQREKVLNRHLDNMPNRCITNDLLLLSCKIAVKIHVHVVLRWIRQKRQYQCISHFFDFCRVVIGAKCLLTQESDCLFAFILFNCWKSVSVLLSEQATQVNANNEKIKVLLRVDHLQKKILFQENSFTVFFFFQYDLL